MVGKITAAQPPGNGRFSFALMRNSRQPAQAQNPGREQDTAQAQRGYNFTLEPVEALTQPTEAAQSHAQQQSGNNAHSRKQAHREQEKPPTG